MTTEIGLLLGLVAAAVAAFALEVVSADVVALGVLLALVTTGVLTPDEFELMKTHPAVGAEILQPIESLREMLPAVRWHHENWNGKGYPDRLKGEAIPLMARIVAVADTFDAITTSRPYQAAYEVKYAAELVTQLAGSRFDAKVVTAFLRAFQGGALLKEIHESTRPGLEIELPIAASI